MRTIKIINWASWVIGALALIIAAVMWFGMDDWSAAPVLIVIMAVTAVVGLGTRIALYRTRSTG